MGVWFRRLTLVAIACLALGACAEGGGGGASTVGYGSAHRDVTSDAGYARSVSKARCYQRRTRDKYSTVWGATEQCR